MDAKRIVLAAVAVLAAIVGLGALAGAAVAREGVKIGNPSFVRKLVSAAKIENAAALQYDDLTRKAFQKQALVEPGDPMAKRVRKITDALLPFTAAFNERAPEWKWEVNLIRSSQINAFCMPGGKIALFTGIIEKLALNDDEIAMVIGHEIAHALREHARERAAKSTLTNVGALAVGVIVGGNVGELARVGGGLMTLKFSRDDETEADLIGMELSARAGYDPRAGITLWEKMSQASRGAPPQWLSTHPSGKTRITTIEKNLPDVMPLFERARAQRG